MNTERIAELEGYIAKGLELRKQGYRLRVPSYFISNINSDLFNWKKELASLKVAA